MSPAIPPPKPWAWFPLTVDDVRVKLPVTLMPPPSPAPLVLPLTVELVIVNDPPMYAPPPASALFASIVEPEMLPWLIAQKSAAEDAAVVVVNRRVDDGQRAVAEHARPDPPATVDEFPVTTE